MQTSETMAYILVFFIFIIMVVIACTGSSSNKEKSRKNTKARITKIEQQEKTDENGKKRFYDAYTAEFQFSLPESSRIKERNKKITPFQPGEEIDISYDLHLENK